MEWLSSTLREPIGKMRRIMRDNSFKLKGGRFRLGKRKKFFTMKLVRH